MTFYKFWNIFNIKEFVDIFFSLFKKIHALKTQVLKSSKVRMQLVESLENRTAIAQFQSTKANY